MDFELSEDEGALARALRSICANRFPLESLRSRELQPDTVDRESWRELAEAGVFSLRTSEDGGGLGLGAAAVSVVFEELGRALVPGPLVASELAASIIGMTGGTEGNAGPPLPAGGPLPVGGPLAGQVRAGVALVGQIHLGDSWERAGGSFPGSGRGRDGILVEHLASLDALVVVSERCLQVVDPRVVDAEPVDRSLDPLTPLWRVARLPEGEEVGGPEHSRRWRSEEVLLGAALCVGVAAATLDMAVAYAMQRRQFGRPVGSFQAVKHICADMLVRVEESRCALHAAALAIDQPGVGDPVRSVAGAALLATRAALACSKACIQVHGGMGFTWEIPAHLYLARSRVLASAMPGAGELEEVVASRL